MQIEPVNPKISALGTRLKCSKRPTALGVYTLEMTVSMTGFNAHDPACQPQVQTDFH